MLHRLFIAMALAVLLAWTPAVARHKQYAATSSGTTCPADHVVWVNLPTHIYHLEGERWFGRTKNGQFECEKAAKAEGDRETRNGQ